MKIYLVTLLYCSVLIPSGIGWESEFLGWKKLNLELANGATIEVETSAPATYRKFTINAFGQAFSLSSDDLAKLEGYPLSSLGTMYSGGYEASETITITLHKFYMGSEAKPLNIDVHRTGIRISPHQQHGN